ncbi:LysR substrate-binding domain-containing protein [Lysinibacter sp. HNR]|uniref:LysR substrate-binding domain-containing protein n=1 Tax=Lysinibacter sp. HNR TaxID=3031408 RepID=UPI0024360FEE|nr:LysR substrate-binding domain-containing protein [Lysinibacter sp. HNR]WGD37396.1 LysR substrate-binding domain-containing protein [Lysinibacter sp. HNR]
MFDLRQLSALLAVSETGSIAAAARQLSWSQPTVSHHLHTLETVLGAEVVARDSTGTHLTALGSVLLPFATKISRLTRDAASAVRAAQLASVSRLRLGVFPSAGARLLPAAVRELQEFGVDIHIVEGELDTLMPSINRRELDAAIIFEGTSITQLPSGYSSVPLLVEELYLTIPADHRLAKRSRVRIAELSEENWILGITEDDPCDNALRAAASRAGYQPRRILRSDDYSVVQGYVEAGIGIGLVPELALWPRRAGVVALPIDGEHLTREISLVISDHAPKQAVAVLRAALDAQADRLRHEAG